jgi:AraC family transcriptional regulator of adaptative response/methylated-DNA-[protein]-cysteine methyltransferase
MTDLYPLIRRAIAYLSETPAEAVDFSAFALAEGLSERALTEQFRRWCGLSPKSFAQAVALDHAKRLLRERASVLDATFELGLSAPSRLHDLFVTHEAMPPGAWRDGGAGLTMIWGVAASPFGVAVLCQTDWGLAGLGFADEDSAVAAAFDDLARRWPNARYTRNDAALAPVAARIFDPAHWAPGQPLKIVLIGTDFEVRVWESLLSIKPGTASTYGALASQLGKPTAARAVGAAVGKNPISFVVPCHRVVGTSGALTGYHWGLPRKRAMLGWETGLKA